MKISEAIEKLTVKRDDALHFQKLYRAGDVGWSANESKAIAFNIAINTLEHIDEPKVEKVEVPDYVAEWIEYAKKKGHTVIESANPWDLYGAEWKKADDWINQNQDSFARAFMDGYTVKPKRWVVKYLRHRCYYYFVEWANTDTFDPIGGPDLDYLKVAEFTDKSKAEAVATLVEGSVEEV